MFYCCYLTKPSLACQRIWKSQEVSWELTYFFDKSYSVSSISQGGLGQNGCLLTLILVKGASKKSLSKLDCIPSSLVTHWMRVRLTSENFKGQRLQLKLPAGQLNEKRGIIENNCTPTDGRSKGHIPCTLLKRNLARVGLNLAKRDKWRGKWTSAERGWDSIAKSLSNEGGILNGQFKEIPAHMSREVKMKETLKERISQVILKSISKRAANVCHILRDA